MAVKKLNSLAKKFEKNKGKEIKLEHSGGGFPDGIENGVAKVTSIKIGEYSKGNDKGKPFFLVRGVAVLPKALPDGTPVAGCQDNVIMFPLFDKKAQGRETEDEHLEYMLGLLQEFGIDTSDLDWASIEDGSLFGAIVQTGLYVRYRTWTGEPTKQFPNPRKQVSYGGALLDFEPEDSEEDELVDNTDDDYEPPADEEEITEEEEAAEEETTEEGEDDLEALAELADSGENTDEVVEAQTRLKELADAAGIDADEIEDWAGVAAALQEAEGSEEEEAEPSKGEVWKFKPPGAKNLVEVEVTAVFAGKKTCNLKNLDNQKTYKGVTWDKLSQA